MDHENPRKRILPYARAVSRRIIKKAEEIKTELIPELKEAEENGLLHYTTDLGQKEHTRDAYITVTAHWIKDFQMKSAVLGTQQFTLEEKFDEEEEEESSDVEDSSSMSE